MIDQAVKNLEQVLNRARQIQEKKTYTIEEMRQLRTILLKTVREDLDDYIGHMPDRRQY